MKRVATFLLALVLGVAAVIVGNYQRCGSWERVPFLAPFKVSQYYVDYFQFGFLKRALPGTVLAAFDPDPEIDALVAACLVVAFSVAVMLAALCTVKNCSVPCVVAIVLCPFTLQNVGMDLGRTDQFGLLAVLVILLLSVLRKSRQNGFYLGAGLAIMTGVLCHEVALFFVPSIAVYLFEEDRSRSRLLLFLAPIALSAVMLALWGRYEGPSATLNTRFAEAGVLELGEIWTRTLSDNLALGLRKLDTPRKLELFVVVPAVALGAWLLAIGVVTRTRISPRLLAACLAPVFLIPIAVDTARWLGFAGMLCTSMIVSRPSRDSEPTAPPWMDWISWAVILFLVLSGAAGIEGPLLVDGFPLIRLFGG